MVFSSLTFIFVFLPIFFLFYFIVKNKYKNIVILVFSLLFYSWGEPKYIILMLLSIVINYFLALGIDKYRKDSKLILLLSIIINFAILFTFKYYNFAIFNINNIFNINIKTLNMVLPIGISFYTFQIISYIVDVYKKNVEVQKNIINLGTYISLFPQLIAGPIVRYNTICSQLQNRTITLDKFTYGIRRFIIGLGKNVIIANNVALIADTIFNGNINQYGVSVLILGTLAYTFQIYFDFSGYSDMAIGLGKMLGFDFLENFNYPYISTSITDFWHRWHISLSSWFKDYVYIPLGGNRVGKVKWFRNIIIVWMLTGLWHGSSWNFVLWGLYFGLILIFEKVFFNKILKKLPKIVSWVYSFILICIGWIIFRLENVESIFIVIKNIFTLKSGSLFDFLADNYNLVNSIKYLLFAIIGSTPLIKILYNKLVNKNLIIKGVFDILIILIFVLSVSFLIQSTYNPFIYFKF